MIIESLSRFYSLCRKFCRMFVLCITAIVLLSNALASATTDLDPLSDEFIHQINGKQNSWRAGRNFPADTPLNNIKQLMGVLRSDRRSQLPQKQYDKETIANLPKRFDAREKWPNCPSLSEIRDQSECGSCWAMAATEVMTDRYCIFSNGSEQVHFSTADVLTCCIRGKGCNGGWPVEAWHYYAETGIVSGGNYNSNSGCKPYPFEPCNHYADNNTLKPCGETPPTPKCANECRSGYDRSYKDDLRFGKMPYTLSNADIMAAELYLRGPLIATFTVYSDFIQYKSGVYQYMEGNVLGEHAVKIIGWGLENHKKYWLIANSWNESWGDGGYFKIARDRNECDIEQNALTGEPIL